MSAENEQYTIAAALVFEDQQPSADQQDAQLQALGADLLQEFARAESDRQLTEQRWLKDLRQFRGQYDPEVERRIGPARSKVFVRKTRTKIKTLDARVADLLFPAGTEKNWGCEATPKPSITPEQRAEVVNGLKQQMMAQMQQQAEQAVQQAVEQGADPQAAIAQVQQAMATAQVPEPDDQVIEDAVRKMAEASAKQMSKVIEDQLSECRYKQVALKAIHSGHLYGIGIIKGPLVEKRIRTRFIVEGGKWVSKSETYMVPFIDHVPVWRFYPDMSSSELRACRFVYERHTMTRHEMSELAARPSFSRGKQRIIDWIKANPKGHAQPRYWDNELRSIGERQSTHGDPGGTYEVLERWGWMNGEDLSNAGVNIPEDRRHESFFSNVWLLPNGSIIKVALQQLDGTTWPYHLYYFDKDESTILPEGLASVMRDDQESINAATRMMIDNAAITSGSQLEVRPDLLSNTENVNEHFPWKVWLRNNKEPGSPAVRELRLDAHINELGTMLQLFDANIDETSAIPRYMTGENVSTGAAGTSSGMSMLMGAVNIVTKDLVTSYDEGITISFIRGMYHWNMKFNQDNSIKGDYDVKATGTASLVAKEVRARQLNEFAQLTANPLDDPWIKRGELNRLRAEANEMVGVVKTQEEFDADQQSPQNVMMMQLQQQTMMAQLQDIAAKVQKSLAEAQKTLASIDLLKAQTVETNVRTAYSALQAGGVATSTPYIAPAGDEILRSSGWKDATPDPSIAQLNGPPVQAEQGTHMLLGQGQQFAEQPRGDTDPVTPMTSNPGVPTGAPPEPAPEPPSGMEGVNGGIETARIEP